MENIRYLDKVLDHLVKGTKIDYENGLVSTPLTIHLLPFHLSPFYLLFSSFSKYCRDTFGLTKEEIDYVWNEYRSIILDKINQ